MLPPTPRAGRRAFGAVRAVVPERVYWAGRVVQAPHPGGLGSCRHRGGASRLDRPGSHALPDPPSADPAGRTGPASRTGGDRLGERLTVGGTVPRAPRRPGIPAGSPGVRDAPHAGAPAGPLPRLACPRWRALVR